MAHETPKIEATPRDRIGTRYARRLRQEGRLPAVVYGHKSNPVAISVDENETLTHLRHGTHVMEIDIEGVGTETCLVKDLQFGYLGDDVVHVDFARVNLDETVQVMVRIEMKGKMIDSTKPGAVMVTDLSDIEVSCSVRNIPDRIRISLDAFEDVVTVADLTMPENVTAVNAPEERVAHIQIQAEEEEPVESVEGVEGAEGEGTGGEDSAPASDGGESEASSDG
ncbi:MAG: 50S ribosomal protein L25 [Phycisphaerales bacterium]|nr:50S ribosomal protein L25 [Phycisphaerales bacterium]